MPVELAAALTAIATKAIVVQLVQGAPLSPGGWADVAGQVVEALVNSAARQESGIQRLGQQIDRVSQQVDEIPIREFGQHMAAGRRYLRDLPVAWRTDEDRRDLIRDARSEFVRAVAIAQQANDPWRQALAEVAIAGCWLWVPSINDVRNAARQARQLLEQEILYGTYSPPATFASVRGLPSAGAASPVDDYIDVVKFCKAYGERSANAALPLRSSLEGRLAVMAALDRWVECANVWVHVTREQQPTPAPPPAATQAATPAARFISQRLAAGRGQAAVSPAFSLRSQPGFRPIPAAARAPSQPPVVLKVTVRNKRATQVMVSFSPTAARVAVGNVAAAQSWTSLASGAATARLVTLQAAAGAGTIPAFQGRGLLTQRAPGVLAFLYPAKP